MNWEAAGTIGEIVGSIAVVISLIYVSLQIRHANKQSELDSLRHTWDGLNQICDRLSESKETASIVNRGRDALESLDDDERLIFEHIHLRVLNTLESWYLQVVQTSKPGPYQESQISKASLPDILIIPALANFGRVCGLTLIQSPILSMANCRPDLNDGLGLMTAYGR